MAVDAKIVMELREKTGISVMECKKALEQAEGDFDKAIAILSERATATALKKADRELGAGTVASYIHSNAQIGALVALACETDFVAKNEDFIKLAQDIAMHVAAMQPTSNEELMGQQFIKNPEKTLENLMSEATQKFGERVEVRSIAVLTARS